MKKKNILIENHLLFLDIPQAVSRLTEEILHHEKSNHLIVVLSPYVVPVANQIARASKLRITVAPVGEIKVAGLTRDQFEFDFILVKASGRDLPQDFILHQERNLRAKLSSFYGAAYQKISAQYPNYEIVLVDGLVHDGIKFRALQGAVCQSGDGGMFLTDSYVGGTSNLNRQFVYFHALGKKGNGINMMIEQTPAEVGNLIGQASYSGRGFRKIDKKHGALSGGTFSRNKSVVILNDFFA
jgi:hypothetical protein